MRISVSDGICSQAERHWGPRLSATVRYALGVQSGGIYVHEQTHELAHI